MNVIIIIVLYINNVCMYVLISTFGYASSRSSIATYSTVDYLNTFKHSSTLVLHIGHVLICPGCERLVPLVVLVA